MKALRLHHDSPSPRLSVDELPVPQPAVGEILVRVSYSGLRGTDLSGARAGFDALTLGEEFSGIVAGYGAGLPDTFRERFPVGAAVTGDTRAHAGAHAEYVALPAAACVSLQPLVDKFGLDSTLRFGALTGAYGLAYSALFGAGGWCPGDRVLILGGGAAGLTALDLAWAAGAADVHLLEIDPARRHLARELGASLALAPEDVDTLGLRYERVVDAAGSSELLAQVLRNCLAPGATVALLPTESPYAALPAAGLSEAGARIVAVNGNTDGNLERVVRLLAAGRLQPEVLIRETVSLEQALPRLSSANSAEGKILVRHGNA